MLGIKAIIDNLSSEEKQEFLLLLGRKNRRTDIKNKVIQKNQLR